MADQLAQDFIEALRALEQGGDVEALVRLYADESVAGNVLRPDAFPGRDGARRFWTEYRQTLGEARSEFRNVIAAEGCAALEWTTQGMSTRGHAIRYGGVTVLEIAGGRVTRSCAYFDPAALGAQVLEERPTDL